MTNKSNFHPLNEELIILIEKPTEGLEMTDQLDTAGKPLFKKKDSSFGLLIPFSKIETEAFQSTTGIVIEMGENVFPNITKAPKVGDTVVFKPYAGMNIYGDDNQFYRILTWKEIRAIYQSN